MFAIVETGGKQYKVQEGFRFEVERLDGEVGSELTLDSVLFVNDGKEVKIGQPYVDKAKVTCEVLEHGRGQKMVVFKKRPKKGSSVKKGHRQEFTQLKVKSISA